MENVLRIDNLRVNGEICPVTDAENLHLTFETECLDLALESKKDMVEWVAVGYGNNKSEEFFQKNRPGELFFDVNWGEREEIITWHIEAYLDGKQIGRSEDSVFERGLFGDFQQGKWIQFGKNTEKTPLFFKTFEINREVKKAKLYITGLGYYVSYLNKKRTDEWFLKPLVSEYDSRELKNILCYAPMPSGKRIYYDVFDVKPFLKQGENRLEVMLGKGWYDHKEKQIEGDYSYGVPKTIFELHLTYENGDTDVVYSDETCFVVELERAATIFKGEFIDFSKELNTADAQNACLCKNIPKGILVSSPDCRDVIRSVLLPKKIYKHERGMTLDFGKNHSGFLSLQMEGKKGTSVQIIYGENIYNDFHVNHISTSWDIQIQTDSFILSGKKDSFHNELTWHAYRYAEIIWDGECQCSEIVSNELTAYCPNESEFICSDPILNDLSRMCFQTFVSNMHGGIPSDCPHRERRGYTGDGQVACEAVMYSIQAEVFYRKWLQDIFDAQDINSGFVPHTAPFSGGGGGPMWGNAVCEISKQLYEWTGDKSVLRRAYHPVQRWIEYLLSRRNEKGLVDREEFPWCLGEWFCPGGVKIPPEYVNTCALVQAIHMFEEANEILQIHGRTFSRELQEIGECINQSFLSENGNYCENVQGANLFALECGIVPAEIESTCWNNCVEYFQKDCDYHIATGIFGTKILFRMLFERGEPQTALKILRQKEYPSYGFMLNHGATTLWECWEKKMSPQFYMANGELCSPYPVSHNHPMFGSVLAYLYRFVAGVDLKKIGSEKKIVFRPYAIQFLEYAKACIHTVYGTVSFNWTKTEHELIIHYSVPYGCKIEFELEFLSDEYYIDVQKMSRLLCERGELVVKKKETLKDGIERRNASHQYANA